ncbi:hypothetical protein Halha_0489 [Halobacteroides halobius DSM 5150]|uniref:DUF3793 domain-containing protein n=1 Tax=Halobacteroides halobius (strain ATCC 35273 / DSM 5150 / MD-1) TaxID=748449 RepID=L0K7Y5_HALHC|nr:DUF3793 family protein [Halobacteroides halobius]AGB40464.1 hypothetical protein Halha_0489 [Halobacteroides halobius DSM 5150]
MKRAKQCQTDISYFRENCDCLLRRIGATIMGVKPAELRSINQEQSSWQRCKETLLKYNQLEIIEIDIVNGRQKVLFYHTHALEEQLQNKNILKFLKNIGYPKQYSLNKYLERLKKRLQGAEFPHEIGVFFGYPLKDVLGFMGYADLEVTHRGEWKYYGNKKVSLLKQKEFDRAREKFNARLNKIELVEEFHKVI